MNIKIVLKFIGYVAAFVSCVFMSMLINIHINEDLGTLLIWLIFLIFPLRIFVWYRKKTNENEIKQNLEFVKKPLEKHDSLFTWLGEEKNTDKIIFELIGNEYNEQQNKEYKAVESLKSIKDILKTQIGEDLTDYYIVREFIKKSRQDSFGEFVKKVFNNLAIGTLIFTVVAAILKNENLQEYLKFDLAILPIKIIVLIFYLLMILALIFDFIMKDKIRSNVLIIILDEIIKEKEMKAANK